MKDLTLTQILHRYPNIWRASNPKPKLSANIPSGYAELDKQLPLGGWPTNQLLELLTQETGIGELKLLLPGLNHLLEENLWLAWINPPYRPYAPALINYDNILSKSIFITPKTEKDSLWAIEQCLSSIACGAVLFWPSKQVGYARLRRFALAAKQNHTLGIFFRDATWQNTSSPAHMRLSLQTLTGPNTNMNANTKRQLTLNLLKCSDGYIQRKPFNLSIPNQWLKPSHHLNPKQPSDSKNIQNSRSPFSFKQLFKEE